MPSLLDGDRRSISANAAQARRDSCSAEARALSAAEGTAARWASGERLGAEERGRRWRGTGRWLALVRTPSGGGRAERGSVAGGGEGRARRRGLGQRRSAPGWGGSMAKPSLGGGAGRSTVAGLGLRQRARQISTGAGLRRGVGDGFGLYLATLWNKMGWTRTHGSGHGSICGGHRHLDTKFCVGSVGCVVVMVVTMMMMMVAARQGCGRGRASFCISSRASKCCGPALGGGGDDIVVVDWSGDGTGVADGGACPGRARWRLGTTGGDRLVSGPKTWRPKNRGGQGGLFI
ncbi:uncharacterized protein M6B38_275595 [Iris pallida]|uniref:Uncharacterized protein n=1 Tax=Iris pallida TaxID=29817 RepID=A0AAX6I612_IRIPA|nr:uncharacterized protein M6B38_275595 [Iris pallida]